jgi:membrane protein DedA with SNARE-associated domain
MRLRAFVLGAALGQLIWTAVFYRFSMAIGAFTERVLRFMERNLLVVSVVVAVLVAAQQVASRRKAKGPEDPPIE